MARRYSAIHSDDFGGGLTWSPDRPRRPQRQPYRITDAADDGLGEKNQRETSQQKSDADTMSAMSSWVPTESSIVGLGAGLSGLALFLHLFNGAWKPELFWLAIILALVAIAKSKAK